MIQHNDSDTSCMRALVLLERNFASEAELPPSTPLCIITRTIVLEQHISLKHAWILVTQARSPGLGASRIRLVSPAQSCPSVPACQCGMLYRVTHLC